MVTPVARRVATAEPRFPVTHPYVRRFWTAVLGPGAVADLLRLAAAARGGRSLRRPVHLPVLVAAGLVGAIDSSRPEVALTVPTVPSVLLRRLPPELVREHARLAL